MAVNIVTGMVGDDHITSHDDRARHAAHFGRGKYVFPVGERFSAEKISENLVRIKDGMCINQGTQMGIEPNDYTDVEIDNGITGVNRHDLICMRYTKNADTGIENASLVVVKGTSGSEPTDPDVIEGNILDGGDLEDDMPLFRVVIEGITITSIVPVFEVFDGGNDKIEELEQEIDSLSDDVTGLNNAIGGISRDVSALQGNVSTLQGNVSSLQSTVSNHTTSITGLEGDIDSLGGRMNTAENDIDTLETNQTQILSDIEDLEHSLSTTSTATGNPISISDSAHVNAEKLKVELEPIQDLHGYDKPWVGGAGKNKFNTTGTTNTNNGKTFTVQSDGSISITGTVGENRAYMQAGQQTLGAGTYILSSGSQSNDYFIDFNFSISGTKTVVINETTITLSQSETVTVWINAEAASAPNNVTLYPMIRTSGDSIWEPYSNICPISGYDETSVQRDGDNKWTGNDTYTTTASDFIIPNTNCALPAGSYKMLFDMTNPVGQFELRIFKNNSTDWPDRLFVESFHSATHIVVDITINESATNLTLYNNSSSGATISNVRLYNTSTSQTYTIALGDTIYGGEVDFVNGVATVTKGYIAEYAGETLPSTWISDRDVYASGTTPTTGAQVVYELATPYTIQLTPQQIKMLKGNNVLTADGDMDLVYQEDSVVGDVKEWAEDEFLPKASATAQHNYSTQEQVVGTWIDGSTLYEKTVSFGVLSSGTQTVAMGLNNTDTIVNIAVNAQVASGSWCVLPMTYLNINNTSEYGAIVDGYNSSTDLVTINIGSDRSFVKGYATIQYTKTTD